MTPLFIKHMEKEFQFTVESDEHGEFIRFAAKCPDFGDVKIYEEAAGDYIIIAGKFTHGHFDMYEGTDDEKVNEAAENITRFLKDLFADMIVCYGSHESGGGWYHKDVSDDLFRADNGWYDLYVWSGLYKQAEFKIYEMTSDDYPLLEDFIYNAIYVPKGEEPPPRDIIFNPDVFVYIDGFGQKPGDCGVIAKKDGKAVGAAWTRIIPAYGHIDDETPELATSVLPEFRGQGIGTMLMKQLFRLLKKRGYKWTSLAVQKKNEAVRFYRRLGYEIADENAEEFIMLKDLSR